MHTEVRDVMATAVVAVEEKTPFKDIVHVMHRHHVSAVPVVDSTGQVRGVVSESDLLLKEADPDAGGEVHLMPERRREQRKAEGTIAAEVMTSPPITVPASATVEDAARSMRRHKVGQLPVIDPLSGRLIGIVGRADVLGVYRRPDTDIQQDVTDKVIAQEFAMNPRRFAVTVQDGRVTVEGEIERRSLVPLLMHAIRHVEGVVSATSHLDYEADDSYVGFYPYL
ncbi:CBS domain-containing protein [Actinomadura sp. HBU206391]|uniref:CBS domain-containing protein n=1 Tax=Actinomadura sp. HBU206391 TaxID=2731692 RepID=UPI00165088FE|nr:CBS domain-containing protein [Actinomadura sp. HBU206391]MBC6461768.1 CBS domain-containing protein [Actinomadura sp. HBU206391]